MQALATDAHPGLHRYGPTAGLPELRAALCKARDVDPARLLVVAGATLGFGLRNFRARRTPAKKCCCSRRTGRSRAASRWPRALSRWKCRFTTAFTRPKPWSARSKRGAARAPSSCIFPRRRTRPAACSTPRCLKRLQTSRAAAICGCSQTRCTKNLCIRARTPASRSCAGAHVSFSLVF